MYAGIVGKLAWARLPAMFGHCILVSDSVQTSYALSDITSESVMKTESEYN